jgi:Tfp pilus assembly protein PilF
LYHRGRALNICADHDTEAENLLSKAVKLDPAMTEAWNELGEAHWKRGDVDTAKTCFEGADRLVRKYSLKPF